ncbi:Copper amine oxidase enzyme domain [Phytophthora infestans]|uniref:Amine oxidase n=1 Tax=Phytophthora infestans TaxID=4787 RepID=A0A8S9U3L4_PHYIN|nr:Copper amine oxidase enzyme domain [Phytophthora infestans]
MPELKDTVVHPLDPLTAKEVQSMKQIDGEAGYEGLNFRYSYVMLREPDHKTLGFWKAGDDIPREIGVLGMDKASNVARFNGCEGLTLHDISFSYHGTKRPILNRAVISEIVIPYGEPQPTYEWQNYFDAGEYQFGRLVNCLVLECDCLGKI